MPKISTETPNTKITNSLFWALPYLIFTLPCFIAFSKLTLNLHTVAIWFCLIIFIFLYIVSWLLFPVAPRYIDKRLVLLIFTMALVLIALAELSKIGDLAYFVTYICSVIIFLSPNTIIPALITIPVCENLFIIYKYPFSESYFSLLLLLLMMVVGGLSRKSVELANQRAIEAINLQENSATKERARVSAQLHDVLGQTLTAINLNTQLINKQLERNQLTQAKATINTITELSREALHDIRRVVQENYSLNFEQEIVQAQRLLKISGIQLKFINITDLPENIKHIAAWLVREGTANVIHHAQASNVFLVANQHGIALINDGPALNTHSTYSGNGLIGLQMRAPQDVTISWQTLNESMWKKWMKTNPIPKKGTGFIIMLELK